MSSTERFPVAERVNVGEVALSVHAGGRRGAPLIVLLHGWPDLAYSWKNLFPDLAAKGYRVLAPDVRGFGGSDAPAQIERYGVNHLVGDVEGLIDREGAETAVILGHDWGGALAWSFAQLKPQRTAGVISLNTPHLPRGKMPPTAAMRARFGDDYYSLAFQAPGRAEAAFLANLEAFFSVIFSPPPAPGAPSEPVTLANILSRMERHDPTRDVAVVPAADRKVFIEAFAKSGFGGGLNWYRNIDANWARMDGVDPVVRAPCLMICGERDPILPPEMTRWMDGLTPDLEKHVIVGVGHWPQWEAPEAVSALVCAWLDRRFGAA